MWFARTVVCYEFFQFQAFRCKSGACFRVPAISPDIYLTSKLSLNWPQTPFAHERNAKPKWFWVTRHGDGRLTQVACQACALPPRFRQEDFLNELEKPFQLSFPSKSLPQSFSFHPNWWWLNYAWLLSDTVKINILQFWNSSGVSHALIDKVNYMLIIYQSQKTKHGELKLKIKKV